MENGNQLVGVFINNILRYLLDENFPRVIQCLEMLTEEQVWYRPNVQSNSVGNLVLHLNGNLNQWILNSIGRKDFQRIRQAEFDAEKTKSKSELIQIMNDIKNELYSCIQTITADELLRSRPVQIYEETGMAILIHVTEHFSYHTGQIAYLTKWLTNQQTFFYKDLENK
jgi:uncharacterized damage-inducible protein DinB